MLKEDEQYLEERGCLIVRTICKYMNTETVFPLLADIIQVFLHLLIFISRNMKIVSLLLFLFK